MFKKANLEIYSIDVEDIITTSGEPVVDPDPNAAEEDGLGRS